MTVTVNGLDRLINDIRVNVPRRVRADTEQLVEDTAVFVEEDARGRIAHNVTHDLESGITHTASGLSASVVTTETSNAHAAYVEFGTGVVGEQNHQPHPPGVEYDYDRNGHGEAGWDWYNPNSRTGATGFKGQAGKPFMEPAGDDATDPDIWAGLARGVFG